MVWVGGLFEFIFWFVLFVVFVGLVWGLYVKGGIFGSLVFLLWDLRSGFEFRKDLGGTGCWCFFVRVVILS